MGPCHNDWPQNEDDTWQLTLLYICQTWRLKNLNHNQSPMSINSKTCNNLQAFWGGNFKSNSNSTYGPVGLPITADLWNSRNCLQKMPFYKDIWLQGIYKLTDFSKPINDFDLSKMNLYHKNMHLSLGLVQVYSFDQDISWLCAYFRPLFLTMCIRVPSSKVLLTTKLAHVCKVKKKLHKHLLKIKGLIHDCKQARKGF